jgi:HEAT repeat protein
VVPAGSSPSLAFWLSRLASEDQAQADEAKEALIAAGDEAVPALVDALDGEDEELRIRALSLLALFGSPRTAAPVAAQLHDSSPRVRQRAAGALARIPSSRSVPALRKVLERDRNARVRTVAVRSLIRLVQTGRDEALSVLMHVMSDPEEISQVRRAALAVMPWVIVSGDCDAAQPARAMLQRLARDPDPPLAERARKMLDQPPQSRLEPWVVAHLLEDLGSRRLGVWQRAVAILGRGGAQIVEPLLDTMFQRREDETYARRGALVLKGLSARQLVRAAPYFGRIDAPIPLRALIDLAGETGSRPLLLAVARLIETVSGESGADLDARALDDVRQRAHLSLARAGSRLAIDDLRQLLDAGGTANIGPAAIEAAARVGARSELIPLFHAYRRSRGVKRLAIRDAVWEICRREKIRRNDRCLGRLEEADRRAAREILGAARNNRTRRRPSSRHIDNAADPLLS